MQIVDRELSGVIYATSSESLANVILPLLNEWDITKNSYKYSLNDDGDHLYVMFENCIFEDMWYQDVGHGKYAIHLSYRQYSSQIYSFFKYLKSKLDKCGFRYRLEDTPIYLDGTEGNTTYIDSESSD